MSYVKCKDETDSNTFYANNNLLFSSFYFILEMESTGHYGKDFLDYGKKLTLYEQTNLRHPLAKEFKVFSNAEHFVLLPSYHLNIKLYIKTSVFHFKDEIKR
jgi:hypothetical protein